MTSNAATIAIRSGGSPCSDAANPFGAAYRGKGKTGTVVLARSAIRSQVDLPQPVQLNADVGAATFREEAGGQFFFNGIYSLPPPGACTIYTGMGDLLSEGPLPGNQPSVRLLDAGVAVTVSGAGGSRLIARTGVDPKEYFDLLGGVVPDVLLPALLLDPGQFSISGAGGADVGPFQGKVEMPPVLTNTNLGSVSIVRRASGLNLTWGPPPAGALAVAILGANYDLPTDSSAMFFCLAPAADRSFTVPPWILSAVPASRPRPYQSRGVLLMGTGLASPAVSTGGIDALLTVAIAASGQTVIYQ